MLGTAPNLCPSQVGSLQPSAATKTGASLRAVRHPRRSGHQNNVGCSARALKPNQSSQPNPNPIPLANRTDLGNLTSLNPANSPAGMLGCKKFPASFATSERALRRRMAVQHETRYDDKSAAVLDTAMYESNGRLKTRTIID